VVRRDEGFFSAKDGTRLFWRTVVPETTSAWVGVLHGYCDHSGRYEWVLEQLANAGFASMAFDYRGHGKADGRRADCGAWSEYLDDLSVFWSRLVEAAGQRKVFILAHSHGALMATHWASTKPARLSGLILSAPYYRLAFEPPPLKLLAAKVIRQIMPQIHMSNELKIESLSRDPAWQKASAEDPLYLHVLTPRWFFGCAQAQDRLAGLGKDIVVPLTVVAGTDDRIASMSAARSFFETVASTDKTWNDYTDFRHEVLCELEKERPMGDIVKWISGHL
jgi:alpha-beta hydrolase superfamily lysophospholipase